MNSDKIIKRLPQNTVNGSMYAKLIILGFFPVLVASIMPNLVYDSLFKILVVLLFFAQVTTVYINTRKHFYRLHKSTLTVVIGFIFIQTSTLVLNLLSNVSLNYFDVINYLSRYVLIYMYFNLPQSLPIDEHSLETAFKGIVIFVIVACMYNILVNGEQVHDINRLSVYAINFKSFYLNRNSFAQILYIAFAMSVYFLTKKRSALTILAFITITLNLLFTFSRTSILSSLVFTIFYLLINKRLNPVRKFILIVVITIAVICLLGSDSISMVVDQYFIRKDSGLTNRGQMWNQGLNNLSLVQLLFGIGFNTGRDLYNTGNEVINEFHSFYVESIINGGIAELILQLHIIFAIIKLCFRNRDKNHDLAAFYVSFIISMLVYGLAESISFFTIGYVGTLFSVIFIALPISYFGSDNKRSYNSSVN